MTRHFQSICGTIAALTLAVTVASAASPPFTGLECFDVKDNRASTAEFPSLAITSKVKALAETLDCSLTGRKPKAKKLCTPVSILPEANPAGVALKKSYLCYDMTCPKRPDIDVTAKDRLGSGSFQVARSKAKRTICFPAGGVGSASRAFIDPPSTLLE